MKIRVLGCSGAIARDCRTTAFLVDTDLLVDAGTGVGDLGLEEMRGINDVLLTHSHLDHIAALPLMLDSVAKLRSAPLRVHALPETIDALHKHIFNDTIWPDFSRIPTPEAPFVTLHAIHTGQILHIAGKTIEVMPAVHAVPAVGYAINTGRGNWVFTGDTERNAAFWTRLNQLDVAALVIETAFSNSEQALAQRSLHLSPAVLADELDCIAHDKRFPIYITHTKPAETAQIMQEVCSFDQTSPLKHEVLHDIRWLQAGLEIIV
jgi:ribonuclease BN (tRNA processing enzyme)